MFNWKNHLRRNSNVARNKIVRTDKVPAESVAPVSVAPMSVVSESVSSEGVSANSGINNSPSMKYLIVGLGNPGSEYAHTRHNIGFDTLDALASSETLVWEDMRHGKVASFRMKSKTLVLLKPSTFMNLSGKAVNYWMQQEKIPVENVLVVVDDLALDLGALRLKPKGSDAGHNGLKNIQETLGHNLYARLRFGIGSNFSKGRQVDFVLGKWTAAESVILPERIAIAGEMIKSFVNLGLQSTMTAFNNK